MSARRFPLFFVALALAALCSAPGRAQEGPISPRQLEAELAKNPSGAAAEALAQRVRATFGADNLKEGRATHRTEENVVLFAVATPEANPRVQLAGNIRSFGLTKLGDTDIWVTVTPVPNPALVAYQYEAGGKRFGGGAIQMEHFPRHPDSFPQPGVPQGKVTQHSFKSRVFAGTTRDYWVYVPAQYKPENPAAVMVIQDGGSYLNAPVHAPTVFDNLIAKGQMPVTVGIFINPGRFDNGGSNRSFEYDTLSDQYSKFVIDEILPEVGKTVKLTTDPERRAIAGISSGAICAWTVAWERPDQFRKVLSWVGSFTNIASGPTLRAGGHNYQALLRKTPKKPIRIWLQDGANDLNNEHGSWPLANQEMAASLSFAGYDYYFDYGQGFHSSRHGAATFPDSLRWLWRDVR